MLWVLFVAPLGSLLYGRLLINVGPWVRSFGFPMDLLLSAILLGLWGGFFVLALFVYGRLAFGSWPWWLLGLDLES